MPIAIVPLTTFQPLVFVFVFFHQIQLVLWLILVPCFQDTHPIDGDRSSGFEAEERLWSWKAAAALIVMSTCLLIFWYNNQPLWHIATPLPPLKKCAINCLHCLHLFHHLHCLHCFHHLHCWTEVDSLGHPPWLFWPLEHLFYVKSDSEKFWDPNTTANIIRR